MIGGPAIGLTATTGSEWESVSPLQWVEGEQHVHALQLAQEPPLQ